MFRQINFVIMKVVKSLPRNVQYLYTTEDDLGISKIFRSSSKKLIYIVRLSQDGESIVSYSIQDLKLLSQKLYQCHHSLIKTD